MTALILTALMLTALCVVVGLIALMLGLRLLRALRWETVEDDQLEFRLGRRGAPVRGWFTGLLASRQRLLTYRRDRRGRFRRYRR
jgi:hypothetical protein